MLIWLVQENGARLLQENGDYLAAEQGLSVGDWTAPVGQIAGTGDVTGGGGPEPVTGTGSWSAPVGTIDGAGAVTVVGSGSWTAPVGEIDGTGSTEIVGTGAWVAPVGEWYGSDFHPDVVGSGDFTAPLGEIDGSGDTIPPVVEELPSATPLGGGVSYLKPLPPWPTERPKPKIVGHGSWVAPVGEIEGTVEVQDWMAVLLKEDEELMQLIELGVL